MIKLEHFVGPSPEQMGFIIEGMRNPINSWDKSDSLYYAEEMKDDGTLKHSDFMLGEQDHKLMLKLAKAGIDHRKFMRMIPVYIRITAGHTWWSQFDTYKVGTVRNSCSKMHKIHIMGFEEDNFDHEGIDAVGGEAVLTFIQVRNTLTWLANEFNRTNEKKYWRAIIELLPMGFHLTANVELNYENLANIYKSRKNHKLDEWRDFCKWIEMLPWSELICQ